MPEQPDPSKLRDVVAATAPGASHLLIVARDDPGLQATIRSFADVSTTGVERRFDLGLACQPVAGDEPAIARMRDVLCERVALLEPADWSRNQLLGLGFVELESIPGCYLYDPAIEDQPREWNNPTHWANPENFDKYRW